MEQAMMEKIAKHFSGEETWVIPSFYYVSLANNDVESVGVTRQPVLYTYEVIDGTEIDLVNADAAAVPTASTGTADSAWLFEAVSGGTPIIKLPFDAPIALTAGATKTFAIGALRTNIFNTTPAAP